MQTDNIIEKASKLGLNTGSSNSHIDNLRVIAEQVGLTDFDAESDIDKLDNILNDMLSETVEDTSTHEQEEPIENLDGPHYQKKNRFGEKEYNDAKDSNGNFNKNHYKAKQQELDQKLQDAKNEKKQDFKKKDPKDTSAWKPDGSNGTKKNVLDKAKDRLNIAKARQDAITNKLAGAKANAYKLMHPGEALKDAAKQKTKQVAKDTGKKAGKATLDAGKNIGKAALKGIKAALNTLIKFAISNPYLFIAILVVILFLLILIIILGGASEGNSKGILGYCNTNCDGMSIKQTSLSRREFVEKVETYFENGDSIRQTFANNAGLIYDVAKSEGINPELVVIRAILEGFSPESNCGGTFNNYWGMACYNGQGCSACAKYSSFEDGVRAYAQNISQYDSVTAMMSRFAYIGANWFNPGSSADGGCYYFPYIKEYMSERRAREVERICNGSLCSTAGGSGCTPTTEEDQTAYATWQVQKLVEQRQIVFGLEADECNKNCYTGDYPINPNDELYGELQLLHAQPFTELLRANGMTIESYDEFIKKSIEKAGVGTREGSIAAATSLIGSLAEMGYKLNYQWGGKYAKIGTNPNWGTPANMDWLCGSESYGKLYDSSKCFANYKWHSFDCSGFVTWAIINGMQDASITQSNITYSEKTPLNSERAVCKPGGALQSDGHIVLVVGIDDEQKKYIVAESTGSNISTNAGGVKISYYSYGANGYWCNNLDEIYND